MKIELDNRTAYRDDDLRAIVRAACRAAGARCAVLRLKVTRRRYVGTHVNGAASCWPGRRPNWSNAEMRLSIPSYDTRFPGLDAGIRLDVIRVALHEALHLAGATHTTMTEEQRFCLGPLPRWAEGLELRAVERPIVDRLAASARRLEHARSMLAKAVTRSKRAATIEAKWRRRVARLSRQS